MTEWVHTEMKVYGNRKDLLRFKNDVAEDGSSEKENSVFSFNKISPMPEDLSPWEKGGVDPGWYVWQCEHWGIKWGVKRAFLDDKWRYLSYLFENPWGPPGPIFATLIDRYPNLTFDIETYDYCSLILSLKASNGCITHLSPVVFKNRAADSNRTSIASLEDIGSMEIKNRCVEVSYFKNGKEISTKIFHPSE